jgi:hypothetical protein
MNLACRFQVLASVMAKGGNGRLRKALRADPFIVVRGQGSSTDATPSTQPASKQAPIAQPIRKLAADTGA